jgi:hypothetical protein
MDGFLIPRMRVGSRSRRAPNGAAQCDLLKAAVDPLALALAAAALVVPGPRAQDANVSVIDYTTVAPIDLVTHEAKGRLHNPYDDTQSDIVVQGDHLFQSYCCSGCHGGGGGGGICPPLANDV